MIVRHVDLAGPPRYCNRGARAFCERHNIDWWEFMQNGVDAQVLIDTGDAMALELVERAKQRIERGG